MREAFENEADQTDTDRLLITMAIPASFPVPPSFGNEKGFDVKSLNNDLDFFNVMTYDYHDPKGLHKQLPSKVIPAFFALMNKFFRVFFH